MFSYFKKSEKKNLLREVYFLARCLVLNWSRRHAFIICHKNMKSMRIFFFTVFRKFSRKIQINKFSSGNEEWIESETATITSDYVLNNHLSWTFHKLTCRQNKCTAKKNEQYLYFSLTLKDTEIFPNLLFWNESWVTATVFHNLFLIINLNLMTVVLHSKQRMAITP